MSVPLISVIVRPSGHAGLRRALASLAAQDHPRIEILVVDQLPPPQAPLPPLPLRPGHTLRRLAAEQPRTPAQAANAGLAAATGDWLAFLDDDAFYDATHLAHLVRQAQPHPHALVVYCRAKLLDAQGRLVRRWGGPYHRANFWYGPVFHSAAALIRREALERGARFDERIAIGAERDFAAQIAHLGGAHGTEPVYVDGEGVNAPADPAEADPAAAFDSDALLRAKWAGEGLYHTERATLLTRHGLEAHARGDLAHARERLEAALAEYPNDPSALNALARVEADSGDLHAAVRHVEAACETNAGAGAFRLNAALIQARAGNLARARLHAQAAVRDPALAEAAQQVLDALPEDANAPAESAIEPLARASAPITPRAAIEALAPAARAADGDAAAGAEAAGGAVQAEDGPGAADRAAVARAGADTAAGDIGAAGTSTATAAPADAAPEIPPDTPRNAPCPCGSGKRFRDCHGQLAGGAATVPTLAPTTPAAPPAPATLSERLAQARERHAHGEAEAALALLEPVTPESIERASDALDIAGWLDAYALRERAYAFAARAAQLDRDAAAFPLATIAARRHQPEWDASVARKVIELARRLDRRDALPAARSDAAALVHVVAPLDQRSDAVRHALELADALSARAPVRVWSPVPPLADHARRVAVRPLSFARGEFPVDGLLVLAGHDIDYGAWLRQGRPRRVVLLVDEPPSNRLLGRLIELEQIGAPFQLDLVFTSAALRDACGAEAAGLRVEHTPLRLDPLRRERAHPRGWAAGPMTVGRIVGAAGSAFHPNDPALFRRLMRRGHMVRLLGGARPLAPAFRNERWPLLGLLPAQALSRADFLAGLDLLLHRTAPDDRSAAGLALIEAMAMQLPAIVFERADAAEWMTHGIHGFIVRNELEAVSAVEQLGRDAALRRRMALAARERAEALVEAARRDALSFYLGIETPATPAG